MLPSRVLLLSVGNRRSVIIRILSSVHLHFASANFHNDEFCSVADWPRVPECDRTLGPPPKKTGPPWSTPWSTDTIITHDE